MYGGSRRGAPAPFDAAPAGGSYGGRPSSPGGYGASSPGGAGPPTFSVGGAARTSFDAQNARGSYGGRDGYGGAGYGASAPAGPGAFQIPGGGGGGMTRGAPASSGGGGFQIGAPAPDPYTNRPRDPYGAASDPGGFAQRPGFPTRSRSPAFGGGGGPDDPASSSDPYASENYSRGGLRARSPSSASDARETRENDLVGENNLNPARRPVRQNPPPAPGDPRPTFSLEAYGIVGDNAAAHVEKRTGGGGSSSGAPSPPPEPDERGDDVEPDHHRSSADAAATGGPSSARQQRGQGAVFNRQMSTAVSAGLPAKPAERPKMPLATSVSLSTAFAIGGCFSATYWIAQTLVHVWKGARLPYPGVSYARWGLELAYLIAYAFVEPIRVFLGEKANRGLHAPTLYASAALALPVAGMHCYLCFGQTYVLKVDEFLNACALAFVGTQTVLSAFAVGAFPRGRPGGVGGAPRGARRRVVGGAGARAGEGAGGGGGAGVFAVSGGR